MKKVILFSAVAIAFTLCACSNQSTNDTKNETADTTKMQMLDTTKLAKGEVFYQCPMHPEEMSGKPGSCSKCGMDLEKVEKK